MSTDEKKEFICSVCGRNDFKHNMALKAHERFHNPEYRKNISEKIKAKRADPDSKYNSPEYKEKIKSRWQDPEYRENISKKIKAVWQDPNNNYNKKKIENQPKEVVYFEKYLKIRKYFDQKTIVNDYIRKEFNGRGINPNTQVNIEQSFDLIIQNNLEIGKIKLYSDDTSLIYMKISDKVN